MQSDRQNEKQDRAKNQEVWRGGVTKRGNGFHKIGDRNQILWKYYLVSEQPSDEVVCFSQKLMDIAYREENV